MAETLQVGLRDSRGKRNARRMRKGGAIPAILYGHGQDCVALSVPADAMGAALRHGSRVVELAGAVTESALIRELQWDTWGTRLLHIDFTRVSADEMVTVTVAVELRGEAPGVKAGGMIEHFVHEVEIECLATAVPDKLAVNVNHLELGGGVTVADLPLPQGARCLDDPETVVVQCVLPTEAPEEQAVEGAEGEAEPEVIGGRKEKEEESEEG
ncbi:MAG: 50S ribosomal protein L25 [Pirellulales bacterium]|nr:50S ribosomal protein L25 [Pirellulales bacterium]